MIVVDASVALKWVVEEDGSDAAEALMDDELWAPALWLSEAANGLWKRARIGELAPDEVDLRMRRLRSAPVRVEAAHTLADDALRYGVLLDHPVYDCFYLALAVRRGCHVVTSDRRFVAAAGRERAFAGKVRLLGT